METMLNVTFSPSVAGTIVASRAQRRSDVSCVNFELDTGKLSEDVCSSYRRKLFDDMCRQKYLFELAPAGMFKPGPTDMGIIHDDEVESYERIMERVADEGRIRIWGGTHADTQCSLKWFCNELAHTGYSGDLYLMEPPISVEKLSGRPGVRGWGFVNPEDLLGYKECEALMSRENMLQRASEWRDLVAEDSMFRSVVDGHLVSVPEDCFDFELLDLFPDTPVKMARIMGNAMEGPLRYHCDSVICWRINKLIEAGYVEVLEDPETWNLTRRILQRVS